MALSYQLGSTEIDSGMVAEILRGCGPKQACERFQGDFFFRMTVLTGDKGKV